MFHTSHLYEISLQVNVPKAECSLTVCCFLNENVTIYDNVFWGWKKDHAGWPNSRTQVLNMFRKSPSPNGTKFDIAGFTAVRGCLGKSGNLDKKRLDKNSSPKLSGVQQCDVQWVWNHEAHNKSCRLRIVLARPVHSLSWFRYLGWSSLAFATISIIFICLAIFLESYWRPRFSQNAI